MGQCSNDVQGMVTPEIAANERKMQKLENDLLKCIQGAINKSRDGLKPMRQRIESQMS